MDAPDEALEELGIELFEEGRVKEDFHIENLNTRLISIASSVSPNYLDGLWRNCDGRFFRYKHLILVSLRFLWEQKKVLTQREAIAFALGHRTPPNTMKMLGITGLVI